MNEIIKKSILDGRLILFLGAGSSIGSSNKQGESPPLSNALAKMIAKRIGWDYKNESLATTYAAAKNVAGIEVEKLFTEQYQYCKPSSEYLTLSKYPWARIYTTNIDDALETALRNNSNQDVSIKNRNDRVEDKDQLFKKLDYVYLNGNIHNKDQGFIFSSEEYGKSSADIPLWYEEMAVDFFQCNFLFIGTKIDEPIFYHQIERYRQKVSTGAPQSYVLTPNATDIEAASLDSYGLTHISASLTDFVKWLTTSVLEPPTPTDIATSKSPVLQSLIGMKSESDKEKYAEIFKYVTLVSTEILSNRLNVTESGTIRDFYKGFKPTWEDILDEVPAKTIQYNSFFNVIDNAKTYEKEAFVLVGPAGSGKSTYLKMAALQLSLSGVKIYFIEQELGSLKDVINELEKTNEENFYLFIDRLDSYKTELSDLFESKIINKCIVVACEGKNIWHNRVAAHLSNYFHTPIKLEEIDKEDVQVILDKLRKHGPWTRLSVMSKSKQFKELFEKSRRQLLIGLIETTTGIGFEKIIERDFQSIVADDDKAFFLMICLCTIHRAKVSPEIISRSLSNISIFENPSAIAERLSGNVSKTGDTFIARHPVYARRVLESIVDYNLVHKCICALLDSFTVYPHPVMANIEKSQGILFKHLFNHRFLKDILRDNRESILSIYSRYEKIYENDGLFWLQYGLATRSFGDQKRAYEQLSTAYHAFPHDHTAHALAQQELILSTDDTLSKPNALRYLDQAIDRLKDLDKTLKSDDTYPIVTMAEGHVKCLIHIEGQSIARVKAKEYTTILSKRMMKVSHERLKEAHDRLFMFSSTGTWNEEA